MQRPRVLLIYIEESSFVRADVASLPRHVELVTFRFGQQKRLFGLLRAFVSQFWWLVRNVRDADVVLGWFADHHLVLPTLFARLYGKPVAVIIGGFDAVHLPALHYGVFASWWRAPMAKAVLRRASVLLPVSGALIRTSERFSQASETTNNGVQVHVPGLNTPHVVLPTGYDPDAWPPGPANRARTVCTAAFVDRERTMLIKGIDLVLATAASMPSYSFEIVGVAAEFQKRLRASHDVPANVALMAPVKRMALSEVYQRASVYLQLSRSEGMPNVVCEAMLSGCIAVGSRVAGIPDAIGEAGVIVDAPEIGEIVAAIEKAHAMGTTGGRDRARQYIIDHFHERMREEKLAGVLKRLATGQPAA